MAGENISEERDLATEISKFLCVCVDALSCKKKHLAQPFKMTKDRTLARRQQTSNPGILTGFDLPDSCFRVENMSGQKRELEAKIVFWLFEAPFDRALCWR